MNEKINPVLDNVKFNISTEQKDSYHGPQGEVFWELVYSDSRVESGHIKNVIVYDASILIARLMKGTTSPYTSEPQFAVRALTVGTGNPGWDVLNPPAATKTQRSLWNEIARKTFSQVSFIDPISAAISSFPTNVVDFTTIFSESEAVGPLCEMGLIGGDVNTNMAVRNPIVPSNGVYSIVDTIGKDMMVNYITHPVISKPNGSVLSITWRLTF